MQFGTRIANNHVAGYAQMGATVVLEDIVNPRFLVKAPPSAQSNASQSDLSFIRHQRKFAKEQLRLVKKKAGGDARRAAVDDGVGDSSVGDNRGGGASGLQDERAASVADDTTSGSENAVAGRVPAAPRRPIDERLKKTYNRRIGKPGYEGLLSAEASITGEAVVSKTQLDPGL
jgi:hypothetical protein